MILATCARFSFTNAKVSRDPTSEADLAAEKEKAQPLVSALEKYRGDTGLYPATLDQLTPKYVDAGGQLPSYQYSARKNDWVYKSDACVEREKPLHGLMAKDAQKYQKEVTQFKKECATGHRYYQLQSRSLPYDTRGQPLRLRSGQAWAAVPT